MARQQLALLALVLWVAGAYTALVGAQPGAANRDPQDALRGLAGVHVAIFPLPEPVVRDGLTESQLRAMVQVKLLQAGIPALWEGQLRTTPGSPELRVTVEVPGDLPSPVVMAEVGLVQAVALERDPHIRTAVATWTAHAVKAAGRVSLRQRVQQQVDTLVSQFIEAYHAANPKESSPPPWQSSP